MDYDLQELIKNRYICFCKLQSDLGSISTSNGSANGKLQQSESAIQLLQDIPEIHSAEQIDSNCIEVRYNITNISLHIIEEVLVEVGFHLDNSLLSKLRRSLYYFTEETQLENLGYSHADSKSTLQIFINRYSLRQHGCRDERPGYYRYYN